MYPHLTGSLTGLLGLSLYAKTKSETEIPTEETKQGIPVVNNKPVLNPVCEGIIPQIPEGSKPTQYNPSKTRINLTNLYVSDCPSPFLKK